MGSINKKWSLMSEPSSVPLSAREQLEQRLNHQVDERDLVVYDVYDPEGCCPEHPGFVGDMLAPAPAAATISTVWDATLPGEATPAETVELSASTLRAALTQALLVERWATLVSPSKHLPSAQLGSVRHLLLLDRMVTQGSGEQVPEFADAWVRPLTLAEVTALVDECVS